jgi:hypothetical protein
LLRAAHLCPLFYRPEAAQANWARYDIAVAPQFRRLPAVIATVIWL